MKLLRVIVEFSILLYALIFFISCNEKAPLRPPNTKILPDTTSHEFSWQTFVLGDGEASRLNDVFIIAENDVWAIGEIFLKNSAGQFIYPAYNAAHWDGIKWEFKKISFPYAGATITPKLFGIWAFFARDIWVSTGLPTHGDGMIWKNYHLFDMGVLQETDGSVNRMWGTSSNNLFFAGFKGSIIYYNGATWQKLAKLTDKFIYDIWGIVDARNQNQRIFCVASDKYQGGEKKILQILPGNEVKDFVWTPQRNVHSVWFDLDSPLYVCGDGVYVHENSQWHKVEGLPSFYTNRVRGNHQYDVFVVGDFGVAAHFNGRSWKAYDALRLPIGNYEGLAVKGDFVVAVGWNADRAVISQGRRKAQ